MRFLFSCMPWEGHFRPLIAVARSLERRGHGVVFATGANWEPQVRAEGFEPLPVGLSLLEGRERFAPSRGRIFALPPEQRRKYQFSVLFGQIHAPGKLPALLEAAREWRPDAVVFDSCDLAAPIAAAALGVPAVNHSFGGMVPLAGLEAAREFVDPLWRAEGLEPDPYAGAFRGLYVDLAPPSFAWEQPHGDVVSLRPVPETAESPPPWVAELEQPLVYVTMGTIYNQPELFRPLLDGLDEAEGYRTALVTLGRDGDPTALGPIPGRVRVDGFVPQAHVLSLAAAVVCHGGSGTTLGALAQGLPLVLVPQAADQFDNAARAEAAGAAVVLRPGDVTADSVRASLERVLAERSYAEAAGVIAREIEQMGDVATVAAAVEEHAARR